MSYHGVFFDFDYTLGDSTAAIAEGYRLGFLALGLDPPTEEQVRHTVGLTLADGYALLTGDHNPERQEAFYHSFQHTVGVEAGGEGRRLMIEGTTLFPGAEETRLIQNGDPAAYAGITAEDYVAVMTRGHKDDLTVQAQALKTPAKYIGVIGSRKKTAAVFAKLRDMGYTDADLQRITTPIGLSIKAETPAEIAVSIAAQLIQLRAETK